MRSLRTFAVAIGVALGASVLSAAASALELEPAPDAPSAASIVKRSVDQLRSQRTLFRGRMIVESPRLARARVVAFSSWEDRSQRRSFIRIHQPAKDAGTGFLKVDKNLWMYVPRVERTMRVPPSMMLQSWMGSDFTNDDLVRDSSEVEDYEHRLLGVDPALESAEGRRAYVIEYLPHEDAPVVWGKILAWIDTETFAPLRQEFYDEDGEKLRVLLFRDFRLVGSRHVSHRWILRPLDKVGHSTRIEIDEIAFDQDFDDSIFTRRNLKRGQ